MRKTILTILLCVMVAGHSVYACAEELETVGGEDMPAVSTYTIGMGDVIEISVWENAELSRQLPVLPDGSITLPLLGSFVVAGKTVETVSHELSEKMAQYMFNPVVTVSVMQLNSTSIYIIGKVNNPGKFPLVGPVDVLQALAMAGGLNTFANAEEIRIFRNIKDERKTYMFDYDAVAKGLRVEENIRLQRGDTVVVR